MLTGVILAGGENRRMNGKAKALLPFSGELLIQRQIRQMRQICPEIIVVTNEPQLFLPILDSSVRIISDVYPRKGPLSGMHAAFSAATYVDNWVVACDMPFISAQAAALMKDMKKEKQVNAVIPANEKRIHPLHGIYDKSCAEPISNLLLSGDYRVMELLQIIAWQEAAPAYFMDHGIDFHFTTNVNTPADYLQAIALL